MFGNVSSVYDGDTFRGNIHGWPAIIGEQISIRLRGADTPEIRGKCPYEKMLAQRARTYTATALRSASVIMLRNIDRGKYFRIVADVYIDGKSLARSLIQASLARAYDGRARRTWC